MRSLLLCALATMVAVGPAGAVNPNINAVSRHRHSSPSCDFRLAFCRGKHPGNPQGCQILFEIANANGGYWGGPEALAKAHFRGSGSKTCIP